MDERLAIVGSGAIACGLAATAAHHGPVLLLARSASSANRARATVEKTLSRLGAEVDPEHVQIVVGVAVGGAGGSARFFPRRRHHRHLDGGGRGGDAALELGDALVELGEDGRPGLARRP